MRMKKFLDNPSIVRSQLFCEYCGIDLLSHPRLFETFTLDHFVPRSKGGGNTAENLRVSCAACDRFKRDRVMASIEEVQDFLAAFRVGVSFWFEKYRAELRGEVVR